MGYVIANFKLDSKVGAQVDLNPKLLAFIIGEKEADIEKGIEFLCSPDPKSRSPEEGGRRLVKLGQYSYQVVNGKKYTEIRNEENRREQNRASKQRQRERARSKPLPGELNYLKTGQMPPTNDNGTLLDAPIQVYGQSV